MAMSMKFKLLKVDFFGITKRRWCLSRRIRFTFGENYLKVQSLAGPYKNKMIEFWDDIVVLCASEKATGQHVESFEDAIDSMAAEAEDEMNSPPTQIPAQQDSTEGSCQKKKRKKDPLVEIVGEMATSLKEYVEMKKNQERPKPTGEEIYGVVSKIVGLNRNDIFWSS
ncbi:hypothetical protein COLO4_23750 [Corchorus olitorius]|uniref:Uncharacterized protein n=1 Tax=Corchorus olitorius TaxID=93759 RepID=A0A1R3IEZ4_9ROSI|nr:hypothetical protein COLO4_23750 [Corchorus olitorius]